VDFKGKFETNIKRNRDVFSDAFNGEPEKEFKGIWERVFKGSLGKTHMDNEMTSRDLRGEFEKNSRGDLLRICVLQHKQDSNTEQTREHRHTPTINSLWMQWFVRVFVLRLTYIYMLHTFAGKFLKSSYFWLLETRDVTVHPPYRNLVLEI
jgi:hypothetical protein